MPTAYDVKPGELIKKATDELKKTAIIKKNAVYFFCIYFTSFIEGVLHLEDIFDLVVYNHKTEATHLRNIE